MNEDEFEKKLQALTGALHRPDPTREWKAEILAKARREADGITSRRNLPPRWLMFGWAASWIAILAMNLVTPRNRIPGTMEGPAASAAPAVSGPPPGGELPALLAFHQRVKLNLDLP